MIILTATRSLLDAQGYARREDCRSFCMDQRNGWMYGVAAMRNGDTWVFFDANTLGTDLKATLRAILQPPAPTLDVVIDKTWRGFYNGTRFSGEEMDVFEMLCNLT